MPWRRRRLRLSGTSEGGSPASMDAGRCPQGFLAHDDCVVAYAGRQAADPEGVVDLARREAEADGGAPIHAPDQSVAVQRHAVSLEPWKCRSSPHRRCRDRGPRGLKHHVTAVEVAFGEADESDIVAAAEVEGGEVELVAIVLEVRDRVGAGARSEDEGVGRLGASQPIVAVAAGQGVRAGVAHPVVGEGAAGQVLDAVQRVAAGVAVAGVAVPQLDIHTGVGAEFDATPGCVLGCAGEGSEYARGKCSARA